MVDVTPENKALKLDVEVQREPQQNEANKAAAGLKLEDVDARIEMKLATTKAEALRDAKNEIDKQNQETQASFMTVFGIFASITSFLTIEFQFLKVLSNLNQIVGFTLVLWALLFAFNIGLDYLVTNRLNQGKSRLNMWLIGTTFVVLIMGLAFIVYGNVFP